MTSRCPHCGGLVAVPTRSRRTIGDVLAVHEETCPGVRVKRERT